MKLVRNAMGSTIARISGLASFEQIDILRREISSLGSADKEHGDMAIEDAETNECLSVHSDLRVILENIESGGERHLHPVDQVAALNICIGFINGDHAYLNSLMWKPGYK